VTLGYNFRIMYRARYRRIILFCARILISHIYWDLLLPRLGFGERSRRTRPKRMQRSARAFRGLAVQMGGVLIKVGQFLSSRVDVLPPEVTEELKGLQDEVPAAPFADIRAVIEREFDAPLATRFAYLDEKPLAAASLGQVHLARLKSNGTPPTAATAWQADVVVKVLRPNIEQIIEVDLQALQTVGGWLSHYGPIRKHADVPALLNEFTRILFEEIDYLAEGRNAETFAANFQGFHGVRVPRVVWSHSTRRVLTLENVLAIKITDYDAIVAAGISRAAVASRLLETYLKQIFEDSFFHADPHPGNLFIHPLGRKSPDGALEWELTFVDFGMVGNVPDNLRLGLRELLIGVGTRDSDRVVHAYEMMDMLLPDADLELIKRAEAKVFDRYWGKNMNELTSISYTEIRELTDEFRELVYDMPFQVPQNVIFLARCVGILAGMCTGLDPQFNVWAHLAPYAQKLMAEEMTGGWEFWLGEAAKTARILASLPRRVDEALLKLERGEVSVRTPETARQTQRLERAMRRLSVSVVFAALLLGGVQLVMGAQVYAGGVLLGGAAIALVWLLFSRGPGRS
jgi:predicted unusual protein kinase regulating ubiquinone biosynthesis (AarF/ABC1/UbiB family)